MLGKTFLGVNNKFYLFILCTKRDLSILNINQKKHKGGLTCYCIKVMNQKQFNVIKFSSYARN